MAENEGARRAPGKIGLDWRIAVTLMVVVVALHVLSWVLLPFVLGAVVAFLCEPVLDVLTRRLGAPRWVAGAGLWLVLFAVGAGIFAAAVLSLAREAARLAQHGPNLVRDLLVQALGPDGLQVFGVQLTPDRIAQELEAHVGAGLKVGSVVKTGIHLMAGAAGVVMFAAVSFFMILSGPTVARGVLWLIPPAQRPGVRRLLPRMLSVVRRFYVGVLAIVVFTTAAAFVGYGLVFHVHGALVLALTLGLLETVPAIGPMVSAGIVAFVGLQMHSPALMGFMIAYAIGLRVVIDDVVAPPVLGRSVALHPVVVMLAYALGAVLFGVTGLLLAVPATACIRVWLEAAYGDTPALVPPASAPER